MGPFSVSAKVKLATIVSLSVSLFFLSACNKKNGAQKITNEELIVGTVQEFENLNPIVYSMAATTFISEMVGRVSLTTMDEHNQWVPLLAEVIPTLENKLAKVITVRGQKKIQAIWRIRDEAVWGDGAPITAADLIFTTKVALDPMVGVGERDLYERMETIEADPADPKKFTVTYKKAYWDFYQNGTLRLVPKHIEEPIYEKYKGEKEGYSRNTQYATNASNPALYNGPYRVKEIKLGSHVELTQNEKWWGAVKPKIKKIFIKLIPSTSTLEANLIAGQVHMTNKQGLSFDQALQLEKRVSTEKLPLKVIFKESVTYEHIDFNLDNPLLKDIHVRKAIRHGVDIVAMCKALFEGKQMPALHNVNPIDSWFTDDDKLVTKYEFNRAKAKALMEKAGFTLGADGVYAKGSERASFVIQTTAGNKLRENIQVYLKDQLREIGIELSIKNEPARVFFPETMSKRRFAGLGLYAWVSSPENSPRSTLSSKNIPNEKNGFSGQNYPGWVSPRVDMLLDQLDEEMDAASRKGLVGKILKEYTDETPVMPLYYRADIVAIPSNMKGIEVTAHQFGESLHVERWELE